MSPITSGPPTFIGGSLFDNASNVPPGTRIVGGMVTEAATQTELDEAAAQAFACTVHGWPAPQGSKVFKGRGVSGKGVMIDASKRVAPWRTDVKHAALAEIERLGDVGPAVELLDGPLVASMVFTFPRPKGHYRTGRNAGLLREGAPLRPATIPDLSKLARSTEDALTNVVWVDDARVVGYHRLAKYYAGTPAPDVLPEGAGAVIRVWRLDQYDHQQGDPA